jgi:hypothetical protein
LYIKDKKTFSTTSAISTFAYFAKRSKILASFSGGFAISYLHHSLKYLHPIMVEVELVEIFVVRCRYKKQHISYLHYFQTYFEHEFAPGGGSGDSGGIYSAIISL